jgi:hypothetical protein
MSLKRVVIEYCAFSGEHCEQFVQFVVRHKPPTEFLAAKGTTTSCVPELLRATIRGIERCPSGRLSESGWCVPHLFLESINVHTSPVSTVDGAYPAIPGSSS